MFAAIEIGGKQYLVHEKIIIEVEKIDSEVGASIECGKVVALCDGEPVLPSYESVKVMGRILEHKRTDKVIVFKKKRRHNYRRKKGHRQNVTVLMIEQIIKS